MAPGHRWSDLQDFGDIQSSQIGPHLVQPLRASPTAITLPSITNLRIMYAHSPDEGAIGPQNWGIFKPPAGAGR